MATTMAADDDDNEVEQKSRCDKMTMMVTARQTTGYDDDYGNDGDDDNSG